MIAPLFDPKLPEMMKIDRTDPFFVFRFLQSIYTNYLDHLKKNNGNLVTKILDKSRAWKGGSTAEYKQHLVDIQALMAKIPQQLRSTFDENLVINLIISNLFEDPRSSKQCIRLSVRDTMMTLEKLHLPTLRVKSLQFSQIEKRTKPTKLLLKSLRNPSLRFRGPYCFGSHVLHSEKAFSTAWKV